MAFFISLTSRERQETGVDLRNDLKIYSKWLQELNVSQTTVLHNAVNYFSK